MTKQEFIDEIAKYCSKYYKKYGFKIVSPAVAQAALESGFGQAENIKVENKNIFGMKYRNNRLTVNNGYVIDSSKEQNPDGTYRDIIDKWFKFDNLEKCCEGYYQFININSYKKVKEQTDPRKYLEEIKKAGYASSLDYVDKCMKIVNEYNLTKFDKEEVKNVIYDDFVDFGNNKSNARTDKIQKITIHHMASNMTAKRCAEFHRDGNREASANYYIGSDGKICLGVSEDRRAWTSGGKKGGGKENDFIAITIEVANNSGAPNWTISDEAYKSLIKLCKYICEKYNIDLHYTGDKTGTLTTHNMFSYTTCPGLYLENLIKSGKIEEDVKGSVIIENQKNVVEQNIDKSYLVRVKINNLYIRENPTINSKPKGFIKPGVYTIIDEVHGWGKLKSGAGYICLKYIEKV